MMNDYITAKRILIKDSVVPEDLILSIITELNAYQATIIVYLILRLRLPSSRGKNLIVNKLFNRFPNMSGYLRALFHQYENEIFEKKTNLGNLDEKLISVLELLSTNKIVGRELFSFVIKKIMNKNIDKEFIGLFLIIIYLNGLHDDDLYELTCAMRDSGEVYNYSECFPEKKIVRRYPTGALSEKTALILPSIFVAVAHEYPVISPFLVAKSLSFTGGTWDKLSVINGFMFPLPGKETVDILKKCAVTMTVAQQNLCPVDTILYQIRSMTDTVDSIELAASSIASKQIACPVNLLLLDVRYGKGAFFEKQEAELLKENIEKILNREKINVLGCMTEMIQPNGGSIGNCIEICEIVSIIKGQVSVFDLRSINEQIQIVNSFFAKIMNFYFPNKNYTEWYNYANNLIDKGILKIAFEDLLRAHQVSNLDIKRLMDDPFKYFELKSISTIKVENSGRLIEIDQKKLGIIVNFASKNKEEIGISSMNILIHKRIGDYIAKNENVVTVYFKDGLKNNFDDMVYMEILECFKIK